MSMKNKKQLFIFVFFLLVFLPLTPFRVLSEEFIDEEDMVEDDQREEKPHSKRGNSKKEIQSQKQKQVEKWIRALGAIKKTKENESRIVSLVSKILNSDSDNLWSLNTLGVFYLQNGKSHLARIIFTRILKKNPKNSSAQNNLGVIALKDGEKEEAISAFLKSLDFRYNNYIAAANLGALYLEAYEYRLALEHLEMAYKMSRRYLPLNDKQVIHIANNYAVALAWNGKVSRADSILEDMIKRNPNEVSLLLNYAILLAKDLDEHKKSVKFLRKADLMDRSRSYARNIKALRKFLDQKQKG